MCSLDVLGVHDALLSAPRYAAIGCSPLSPAHGGRAALLALAHRTHPRVPATSASRGCKTVVVWASRDAMPCAYSFLPRMTVLCVHEVSSATAGLSSRVLLCTVGGSPVACGRVVVMCAPLQNVG
eukprot:SAG11_NODE_12288_length_710_cov_99.790507_1_plen_124_part_10